MEEEETELNDEMDEPIEDMIIMQGSLSKDAVQEIQGFLASFGTVTSHPVGDKLRFLKPSSPAVGRRILKSWGSLRFCSGEPVP